MEKSKQTTILIIEDDISIGNVLEETLTREGYAVLRAYSGTEALFVLSQEKIDLVLLDLMLPGLNGEEVLPKIKGIPVIVVSAKVDVDSKVEVLLGGAVDYVTKPFQMKELLARIAVHLRNSSGSVENSVLTFEDLTLHTDMHIVTIGTTIEHVTDWGEIASYGVMTTPALVVDGKVVSFGKVLKKDEVVKILKEVRG